VHSDGTAAQTLSLVDLRDLSEDAAHKNLCRMVAMAMESTLKPPLLVTDSYQQRCGRSLHVGRRRSAPLRLMCCPNSRTGRMRRGSPRIWRAAN
jgi:hypothetical protein